MEIDKVKNIQRKISDLEFRQLLCFADVFVVSLWMETTLITEKLPWFMESIPMEVRPYIAYGIFAFVAAAGAEGVRTARKVNKLKKQIDS